MSEQLLQLPPDVARRTDAGPVIRFGLVALGGALLVFVLWATLVPIASSVVTTGTLVTDGRNKLVQHPGGGRVLAIHVRPGDRVERGQPLLALDERRARAELSRLEARARMLRAARRRLKRQLEGDGSVLLSGIASAPLRTASIGPPIGTAEVEGSEESAFVYGRQQVEGELAGLKAKIDTLRRQRDGLRARVGATRDMLAMSRAERDRLEPLVRSGYVARNRLRDRERHILELEGKLATQVQDERAAQTRIAEIRHEQARVRAADKRASAADLSRIATELAELQDAVIAARAAVEDNVLRAPAAGTVTKLAVSTVGGVVGPGDVVAEIVPGAAAIEVSARVRPGDIAHVAPGHGARITVTAFAWRGDDAMEAVVTHVEADAQTDERTGETFFAVLVRPADDTPPALLADLRAGMQAEVGIRSGDRTFMAYVFEPVLRSFRKAFRET